MGMFANGHIEGPTDMRGPGLSGLRRE